MDKRGETEVGEIKAWSTSDGGVIKVSFFFIEGNSTVCINEDETEIGEVELGLLPLTRTIMSGEKRGLDFYLEIRWILFL